MAEALFVHHLSHSGLEASVISRGLAAPVGRPPHPHAIEVANAHGVPLPPEKRAGAVTSAEIALAAAIFIMDSEHRREVQRRYPVASGKTFLLGQWQSLEIADPINEPLPAFELAWQQCNDGAKAWVERLSAAGLVCAKATA